MTAVIGCGTDQRRRAVRAARLNGIDSVDVSADQLTLTVLLFGPAPPELRPANFVITGGTRITGIRVIGAELCDDSEDDLLACLTLTVDRPGDFSDYQLCIVDAEGAPYPGFDPRYACICFSFKQNCPATADCDSEPDCPPPLLPAPEIDYLARDYASFRQLLLDRLSLTLPAWTERHVPDLGIVLVEAMAYLGDRLSYRQDAVATEAYLNTARLRVSVRRHARLVDYRMHDGCSARAWVCLQTSEQLTLPAGDFRFAALPAGQPTAMLETDLGRRPAGYQVYEPVQAEAVTIYPSHTSIRIWTWGDEDCCLPAGSTSVVLADDDLHLVAGDVLVLRERIGPVTGAEADADPTHCQAVRLTGVHPAMDELYQQKLLEVTWSIEDALTFDLCVSARGGPDCTELTVGVADGNVVLVDHGRSLTWCDGTPESVTRPPARSGAPGCPPCEDFGCGCDEAVPGPAYPAEDGRFSIEVSTGPVSQIVAYPDPAAQARAQAHRLQAIPARARARLAGLSGRLAGGGDPTAEDLAYLRVLFPAAVLNRLRLGTDPAAAVATLLARFDQLLQGKLDRLHQLGQWARAGYVLTAEGEGWEVGQSWGEDEGHALAPELAAFRGPAAAAANPDPRQALPAVRVWLPDPADLPPADPAANPAAAQPPQLADSQEPTESDDPGEPAEPVGRPEPDDPIWLPRRDLLDSAPADRFFVGELDDDGVLALRFDSFGGPPPGRTVLLDYRIGTGTVGNLGRNAINTIVFCSTRQGGITAVGNPLPAVGGVDPEPVDLVRRVAPRQARHRLLRAITAADYAGLAELTPGLQRAAADLRWTGSWYEAQVALDPLGAEVAGPRLTDRVRESLYRYRRIGHDLSVATAELVPLDLRLRVAVQPGYLTAHVRSAVLVALGTGRLPDGSPAAFHPDNLSFATPVRINRIVAAVAALPGVRHAEVTGLQPLFGMPGTALADGLLRLGTLQIAQLDNDPNRPENGRITLTMVGGR